MLEHLEQQEQHLSEQLGINVEYIRQHRREFPELIPPPRPPRPQQFSVIENNEQHICQTILCSGDRKGQLCGKINCSSHLPRKHCVWLMKKGKRKGMKCDDFCCLFIIKNNLANKDSFSNLNTKKL